jgi:ribosomal protein S13
MNRLEYIRDFKDIINSREEIILHRAYQGKNQYKNRGQMRENTARKRPGKQKYLKFFFEEH